jgi:hypothetical protein
LNESFCKEPTTWPEAHKRLFHNLVDEYEIAIFPSTKKDLLPFPCIDYLKPSFSQPPPKIKYFFRQKILQYKASDMTSLIDFDFNHIHSLRLQIISDFHFLFFHFPSTLIIIKNEIKLACSDVYQGLKFPDGKLLFRFLYILYHNLKQLNIFQSIPIQPWSHPIHLQLESSLYHPTYLIKPDQFTSNNNPEAVSKFFFKELSTYVERDDQMLMKLIATFLSIISVSILSVQTEDFKSHPKREKLERSLFFTAIELSRSESHISQYEKGRNIHLFRNAKEAFQKLIPNQPFFLQFAFWLFPKFGRNFNNQTFDLNRCINEEHPESISSLFDFFVSGFKIPKNQISDDCKYPFQTVEIHFFRRISRFLVRRAFPLAILSLKNKTYFCALMSPMIKCFSSK